MVYETQLTEVDFAGQVVGVPEEAFYAIETLLPTGKGKFLELWAPYRARRPGWVHVAEATDEHPRSGQ